MPENTVSAQKRAVTRLKDVKKYLFIQVAEHEINDIFLEFKKDFRHEIIGECITKCSEVADGCGPNQPVRRLGARDCWAALLKKLLESER